MSKTIYAVMYAYYSDWQLYGYFSDRLEAEKYCAAHPDMELHVEELACMDGKEDLHNIELKYEYRIVFDRKNNTWKMREDPEGYEFYQSEYLRSNSLQIYAGGFNGWIAVRVNTNKNDRKLAENIAQVILYQYLSECDNEPSKKTIKEFNKILSSAEIERERIRKEKALKEKELAELKRLKEKYEC